MAEYKKIWKNKLKQWRLREGMSKTEFSEDVLGIRNIEKYKTIEEGKATPSSYQRFLYKEANK